MIESLDASGLLTIRLVEASNGQTNFALLSAVMVVTDSLEESWVSSMLNTALIRSFTRRMSGKVNETLLYCCFLPIGYSKVWVLGIPVL